RQEAGVDHQGRADHAVPQADGGAAGQFARRELPVGQVRRQRRGAEEAGRDDPALVGRVDEQGTFRRANRMTTPPRWTWVSYGVFRGMAKVISPRARGV